jgi:endonuclease/exonuclease/phosphatase family metal-dependent hydrolase
VDEIAAQLRQMDADVAALQEVDVRMRRSGFVSEPQALAATLNFSYVFAGSIRTDGGDYGIAVLSRWPFATARRHRLAATDHDEPRIALEVTVCVDGRPLHVLNHHADIHERSREPGLFDVKRIVRPNIGRGVMVVGDFNETPDGPGVASLEDAGLVDLGAGLRRRTTEQGRIDYLLADHLLARRTSDPRVWTTDKSDHNAMVVDVDW